MAYRELDQRDSATRDPSRARGNNRERILEASMALFNSRGAAAVSTNTIAGHLGISPGNLYYHFANKEAIVRELWLQSHDAFALKFALPDDGSLLPPERLADRLLAALDGMVEIRFLVRDLDGLLARDAKLAEIVRAELVQGQDFLVTLFDSLIDHGVMTAPSDRSDLLRLGTNILSVLLNWVRLLSTTAPGAPPISASDLAEGALHAFVIVEPRIEPGYAMRVRTVIENSGTRRRSASASRAKRRDLFDRADSPNSQR
jgi:AcrR family transcriptional regulator